MLIDSWLLQHAAELAEQAGTQLSAAAGVLHHEAHVFMEEITQATTTLHSAFTETVNAGCAEH
ncbi:hypothetical protein [Winogradskya humida]|uniref:Uncharacterized protein n=1 Tax=Winogradskya humida TaxID=113566 RepID=A0ABQ3ZKI6_9ACTN|nr:hypothetical protein [Actinoplanes humidus]GIE18712.1 hypothetical protein Ahu01nite_018140 [Actinoplanes humidus]